MRLPDNVYRFLKWTALIALPALATFYGIVGKVWEIPFTAEVVTTISAAAAFIGTLIGVSTVAYNKDKEDEQNGL